MSSKTSDLNQYTQDLMRPIMQPEFNSSLQGLNPNIVSMLSRQNISLSTNPVAQKGNISMPEDTWKNMTVAQPSPIQSATDIWSKVGKIGKGSSKPAEMVSNSGFGKFMNKNSAAIGAVNEGIKMAGNLIHGNKTGLQQTDQTALQIRDAQYTVLKSIPITAPFAAAAEALDNTLGAITGSLGSATKADKVLTAIPLMGNTAAIFAGKTNSFKGDIQDINTGDFGGSVSNAMRAQELSGVKSVAAKRLNKQINSVQKEFDRVASVVEDSKRWLNNNIGQDLTNAMLNKYSGQASHLSLAKQGMKFPGLEEARIILSSKAAVKSFQKGGKLEKENIIPTGALHKNLNHIDNSDLNITPKGIPVGTYEDGGEFSQTAEIEAGEIIFSLDVTKQLEAFAESYKETFDDDIAVECGKFLVDQILNNTRDDDKVIKKTE